MRLPFGLTTMNAETTSSIPGYAMRCDNLEECEEAIIGKALEPLERGTGVIKMGAAPRGFIKVVVPSAASVPEGACS